MTHPHYTPFFIDYYTKTTACFIDVVPIEVKAGTTGTLKSLHLLMGLRKLNFAVRINSDIPSVTKVKVKDSLGTAVQYQLLSIPFYLLGQLHRLINTLHN